MKATKEQKEKQVYFIDEVYSDTPIGYEFEKIAEFENDEQTVIFGKCRLYDRVSYYQGDSTEENYALALQEMLDCDHFSSFIFNTEENALKIFNAIKNEDCETISKMSRDAEEFLY